MKNYSKAEQDALLLELSNTKFWDVIIQRARIVDSEIVSTVLSVDPFKEPSLVARGQGKRLGIYSIIEYTKSLIGKGKDAEEGGEELSADFPGYGM